MEAIEHLKETLWKVPDSYYGHNPVGEYCIYGRHRDSSIMEESNYELILAKLQELAPDHCYDFRASHWAVGWVETIMLKPDAPNEALQYAGETICALADYPCLDEMDYSDRQYAAMYEYWDSESESGKEHWCDQVDVKLPKDQSMPDEVFDDLSQSEMFN